jgi:predicted NUDIX family NTP pyrophosphohydrolase
MIPEVDRGAWFTIPVAKEKINPAQAPLVEELARLVEGKLHTG